MQVTNLEPAIWVELLSHVPLSSFFCVWFTETPRFPQEALDPILPLLHGKEGQVCQVASWDEQPGPDEDPLQEVQGAARQEKGLPKSTLINLFLWHLLPFLTICNDLFSFYVYRRNMLTTSWETKKHLYTAWWSLGEMSPQYLEYPARICST